MQEKNDTLVLLARDRLRIAEAQGLGRVTVTRMTFKADRLQRSSGIHAGLVRAYNTLDRIPKLFLRVVPGGARSKQRHG